MLQFERSGIGGLSGGSKSSANAELAKLAKESVGESGNAIADTAVRKDVTVMNMNRNAFQLTAQRANEENKSGIPGAATSIFKLYGAALQQDGANLRRELLGFKGLGAHDTNGFDQSDLAATEEWLHTRTTTIYGGSNESRQILLQNECSVARLTNYKREMVAVSGFQTIGVDNLTPHIGAEIDRVDLSKDLSNEQFSEIYQA